MAIIKVQKGTKDILPPEMPLWHFMETKANEVFTKFGAKEVMDVILYDMSTNKPVIFFDTLKTSSIEVN